MTVRARPVVETRSEAASAFPGWQKWCLLGLFALVVALRLPNAWVHGRFQDEEATVFLAYAWHFPWQQALFRSFAGYLNLGANSATVLLAALIRGGGISLDYAPYLTMALGLMFQALPALLILTGRARWLRNRLAVIAALIIIAISPATEEVSFNVIHIQLYLALCAAIILALDLPVGRIARIGYPLILFAAPLCGPAAVVILPLFALRWFKERQPDRLLQLGAFIAGAAMQLLFFFESSPMRSNAAPPDLIAAAMFIRVIVLRLAGSDASNLAAGAIYDAQVAGNMLPWWIATAGTVGFLGELLILAARGRDSAIWLILSAVLIAIASFGFGMLRLTDGDLFGALFGERYNFLPCVLLGLGLIVMAERQGKLRPLYVALCFLMLASSIFYYPKTLSGFSNGPSWPAEVSAWRKDHDHPLAVWGGPVFVDLSDRAHPCVPPIARTGRPGDPRYCESGWMAGFYAKQPRERGNLVLPPLRGGITSPPTPAAP